MSVSANFVDLGSISLNAVFHRRFPANICKQLLMQYITGKLLAVALHQRKIC